jgi:hypothetical protein
VSCHCKILLEGKGLEDILILRSLNQPESEAEACLPRSGFFAGMGPAFVGGFLSY